MEIKNNAIASLEQMSDRLKKAPGIVKDAGNVSEVAFKDYFRSELIKFSKHANERLSMRSINLDNSQLKRLETGMNKAKEKGLKDPLVMIDNIAFIVNTNSNTVVTAVSSVKDAVFTNIDGAVIG